VSRSTRRRFVYLAERRLQVEVVGEDEVRATCAGGQRYELGIEAGEKWCSCPARGRCAHLVALAHVVTLELAAGGES
jgi:uncharacterized Zn finger protein